MLVLFIRALLAKQAPYRNPLFFCLSVPDDNLSFDRSDVLKFNICTVSLITQGRPLLIWVKRSTVKVTGLGILHLPTNSIPDDNFCSD